MINSIYSNSYALQTTPGLFSKAGSNADENSILGQNLSTDSVEAAETSANIAYIPLKDHLGMMQNRSKVPVIPPEFSEEGEENETSGIPGSIDTDGDGSISADEYENLIEKLGITNAPSADEFFTRYDTDGDGEITGAEMDAGRSGDVPPVNISEDEMPAFSSDVDTDGDGSISADEYDAYVSRSGIDDPLSSSDFFAKYDTDSDGELTVDEIKTAYDKYVRTASNVSGSYETNFEYAYDPDSTNFSISV